MSISSPELWRRIELEGLATSAQCRQWATAASQLLSADEAASGLNILQRLVELDHLSNYQAKILAGQSTQPLRFGKWLIQQRVKDPLWPGWMVVRNPVPRSGASDTNNAAGSDLWARPVDAEQLAQLRSASPSLRRALQCVAHPHTALQTIAPPEMVDGKLLALVVPISGQLLSEKFRVDVCSPELALQIIREIASGLAALHSSNIAHGRVLPDRIYWQSDRAVLAMDPLCAATTIAHEGNSGLLSQSLGTLHPTQFMAPEFQSPGQLPTPTTDVYSLGCVWWWLVTGKPLVSGESATLAVQQHARSLPKIPADIECSKALQLCMRHALGRNLPSRFDSAGALLNAIDAAIALPAQSPTLAEPHTEKVPATSRQNPVVSKPAVAFPADHSIVAGPIPRSTKPRDTKPRSKKNRRSNPWLLPVLGGCGFLILLLLALSASGVLQPGPSTANTKNTTGRPSDYLSQPATAVGTDSDHLRDPLEQLFQIVEVGDGTLWVPPAAPAPLPLDLLPPGGQLFLSLRPADLLDDTKSGRGILAAFDRQLSPLLELVKTFTGMRLEQISQMTAVFHPPLTSGGMSRVCLRCELLTPQALSDLKSQWQEQRSSETIGDQVLLVTAQQLAYYVSPQPLVDSQSVSQFSVGPLELMRDAAELAGTPGPLVPQLKKIWDSTDRQADLSLFGSAPFLFTAGRGLLASGPPRMNEQLKEILGGDMRAFGIQMRFDPQWYIETRVIGANDLEAGKVLTANQQRLRTLPPAVEAQLVSQTPHPYWRALALRFPQMLRTVVAHTRFGVENGTAISNTYLPSEAAGNILLASWIALQPGANLVANPAPGDSSVEVANNSLGIEGYLARPMRLSFDQEPIEVALALVAEEANDGLNGGLNGGMSPVRFVLDGDAFEKAGITRNQQLREFRIDDRAVRVALTEIAKRGNPVTTVTDTRQEDQKLIWVVKPDPDNAGHDMISLTTRVAAQAAGLELPVEFRK